MTRSHQYSSFPQINADIAVAKAVGSALQQQVNAKADAVSLTTSRTGEIALLLGNYIAYRLDILNDEIGERTPTQFVVKLRNRVNGVTRACDELVKTHQSELIHLVKLALTNRILIRVKIANTTQDKSCGVTDFSVNLGKLL